MYSLLSHRNKKRILDSLFYCIWISIKLFSSRDVPVRSASCFFFFQLVSFDFDFQLIFSTETCWKASIEWFFCLLSSWFGLQQSQNEASNILSSSTFSWVINKLNILIAGFHRSQRWRLPLRNFFYCDCTLCRLIASHRIKTLLIH